MKVHAKRGSAAAAVVALLLTTLGTLFLPATAGAAVSRSGGVTGVRLNGTGGGDGLSYLGIYEVTDPTTGRRRATCIEWDGRAPDDEPGSYVDGGLNADPILSSLAYKLDHLPVEWSNNENILAGVAVVGKYRSSQLGLPGATSYPVGLPDPTGPASFRLANCSDGVRTYNGNQLTSADEVAKWAWISWQSMSATGRDFAWTKVSETAHPGVSGATIDTVWELRNSDGALVVQEGPVTPLKISNVSAAEIRSADFADSLDVYPYTLAGGRIHVRFTIADGSKPAKYGVSTVSPSEARVLEPVVDAQQTMIVGGSEHSARGTSVVSPAMPSRIPTSSRIDDRRRHTGGPFD